MDNKFLLKFSDDVKGLVINGRLTVLVSKDGAFIVVTQADHLQKEHQEFDLLAFS